MSWRDWKWQVATEGEKTRRFKHEQNALEYAARQVVIGQPEPVRVLRLTDGWASFSLRVDMEGALLITGMYTDIQQRYLRTRFAHEARLHNVGNDQPLHNVKYAA